MDATLVVVATLFMVLGASCDRPVEPTGSPRRAGGITGVVLRPTSFKYGYDGKFGPFDMADTAEAYNGGTLVGRARSIELLDSPNGGPKMMKIHVTHYSTSGEEVYSGLVFVQAGFGGGKLIREEDINGRKEFTVFGSWQFGH